MKQVLLRGGGAVVEDVPAPGVGEKNILVRVHYSCISVGTESAGMTAAAVPLYKRALKQPENVRLAFKMMQEQGVARTVKRIQGMLATGQPTGYSAAGEVIAIGSQVEGFSVGDRVACAGAGIANHAEIIDVPVNLAVRVPDHLSLDKASTVTLGAIALQGIRRAAPTLGETIVVIGLGILGQLTVQMLKSNGCRVVGVDLDPKRIEIALATGMERGFNPQEEDFVAQIKWMTDGLGADATIVTAAASSSDIISQAMQACRKKGRVVLVGDVGLDLKREDFYKKELDFLVSTSYGPGRYDPNYEEGGQDYPLPYVRWTENRNMAAYLALIAGGGVEIEALSPQVFDIASAEDAYQRLSSGADKPLLALLQYPPRRDAAVRRVAVFQPMEKVSGKIRVAVVGAGGFAQGMHLPNLLKLRDHYQLRWVVSRTGATAKAVAKQYEVPYAGTDYDDVLNDPEVDLVLLSTRHNLHADMTIKALRAGKHVFVEKPLAMHEDELAAIEAFYEGGTGGKPVLMTGYNRRFSPPVQRIQAILAKRNGPMMISYRMNAGYLLPDHWVHGAEGGGRNIGEACHIYDLFGCLTQASCESVHAVPITNMAAGTRHNENFLATMGYADGSVASLLYSSLGAKEHPKESMDIFVDGKVITMDDYVKVSIKGSEEKGWAAQIPQKGQMEELLALREALQSGKKWPTSLEAQIQVARAALEVESQLLRPRAQS